MPLTDLDKELVAVAISVAAGCRPCITHHLVVARRAGGGDEAIENAVTIAGRVRSSAGESMRRHALGLDATHDGYGPGCPLDELMALGAALVVNCTAGIDRHRAAVLSLGIPGDRIDEVFALAAMIRAQAIGHAEARLTGGGAQPGCRSWAEAPKSSGCC